VPNPCALCRAGCCRSYVITTTIYDIIRISEHIGGDPASFCVFHEPRLLGYDPDMVLDTTDGYGRYLLGIKSHPCIFLDAKGRCSIHESAPLSCGSYPFRSDGSLNARFCPLPSSLLFRLKGPDIGAKELLRELDMHKEMVAIWNRRGGTREDAMGFLLSKGRSSSC